MVLKTRPFRNRIVIERCPETGFFRVTPQAGFPSFCGQLPKQLSELLCRFLKHYFRSQSGFGSHYLNFVYLDCNIPQSNRWFHFAIPMVLAEFYYYRLD